jgi:hypothetical protein
MQDWQELGIDSLRAAKALLKADKAELSRSIASRAYYAAYSVVTAEIVKRSSKMHFRNGWQNPAHSDLPRYVRQFLGHLPRHTQRNINTNLRVLWYLRVDADYRPRASVDTQAALSSCRVASAVFHDLEVSG